MVGYYKLGKGEGILVSQRAFIVNNRKLLVLKFTADKRKERSGKWSLPGGLLEFNEDMESGLKREIKEETNLEITAGKPVAVADLREHNFILNDGRKLNIRFIQIAFECKPESGEVTLSEEHSAYRWVTKKELSSLEMTPNCKHLVESYLR